MAEESEISTKVYKEDMCVMMESSSAMSISSVVLELLSRSVPKAWNGSLYRQNQSAR